MDAGNGRRSPGRWTVGIIVVTLACLPSCSDFVDVIAFNPCSDAVTFTLGEGSELRVAPESFARATAALADDPNGDGVERVDYSFEDSRSESLTVKMGKDPVVVLLRTSECP